MIDLRFEPPKKDSENTPIREQLAYMRTFLSSMVDDLNLLIDTINSAESFEPKQIGVRTPGGTNNIMQVSSASKPVDMGGKKISNLGMPEDAGDAASMEYVLTIFNQQKGV